jgi:hypothetical protein
VPSGLALGRRYRPILRKLIAARRTATQSIRDFELELALFGTTSDRNVALIAFRFPIFNAFNSPICIAVRSRDNTLDKNFQETLAPLIAGSDPLRESSLQSRARNQRAFWGGLLDQWESHFAHPVSRIALCIGAADGCEATLSPISAANFWQPPYPECRRCRNILVDLCAELQDRLPHRRHMNKNVPTIRIQSYKTYRLDPI